MLNQTGITSKSAITRKTILFDTNVFFSLPCKVSGAAKTVIKAGTPIKGDLTARDTAFTVAGASEKPAGILFHDVILDDAGKANATVLVFGFVDQSKLESDVVAKLTSTMKDNLPKITFCV